MFYLILLSLLLHFLFSITIKFSPYFLYILRNTKFKMTFKLSFFKCFIFFIISFSSNNNFVGFIFKSIDNSSYLGFFLIFRIFIFSSTNSFSNGINNIFQMSIFSMLNCKNIFIFRFILIILLIKLTESMI